MAGQLLRVRKKLGRADVYIAEVETLIKGFLDSDPYPIVFERQADSMGHPFYVGRMQTRAEPPSFEIAHALGGAIHTLRASLDYLAWELTVKRLGYRPAEVAEKDWLRRVAFPIFLHEREFKLPDKPMSEQAKGSAAMLQGMARKHAAHIKRLQPFRKPDHPLWVLSELDNIDKHRHAHVMRRVNRLAIQAGPKPLRIKREYLHPGGTVKDNTKVAQVRVRRPPDMCETEFQTQMNMCFERSFSLTFEQRSPAEGQDIIEVLHQLREHVGGIVNEFEPAFLA